MNASSPERWTQLWRQVAPLKTPANGHERLRALYSEPHRHYHDLRHISDCLVAFDRLAALAREPLAVELAIWFHDAVYDPRAADNEERSAQLAREWLREAGAEPALTESVGQLVLATKSHDGTAHADAPLLVDIDLSILGQPPGRFWEYEEQIRREYDWVPAAIFCQKRAEILERFLGRERIYQTDVVFREREALARDNLRTSVGRLKTQIAL